MTIVMLMPMSEGVIVAADGEGAIASEETFKQNFPDKAFFRFQKVRPFSNEQIAYVMGNSLQVTMENGAAEVTFDLLNEFIDQLKSKENQVENASDYCCRLLEEANMSVNFGNGIASIGLVSRTNSVLPLNFSKGEDGSVVSNIGEPRNIEDTVIIQDSVKKILSDKENKDHVKMHGLIGKYRNFFVAPTLPFADRTREICLEAIVSMIIASRTVLHERRIGPIGKNYDAYLLKSDAIEELANESSIF